MSVPDIVVAASILCLASSVQSAIGFGYALVATPLLIWTGIPLPNAITLVAVCSFVQSVIGARHLRASVPRRLALIAITIRTGTLIIGLRILRQIAELDSRDIRFVVGIVLCLLVISQLVGKVRPADTVHWSWGALAFSTSGLLAGVCGMGGPPLVLWAMHHDWPSEKIRGFLFAVFAASIPIQVGLLYFTFGMNILRSAGTALLLAPAVFLGAAIGLPLGNRLPRPVLSGIVYATLLVISLSSIIPHIIQKL
ncbi:MAG: sulfite exporter TauE/SafE family protein [Sedimentisphaerales bacterium]|nr:sulfite exporter TauE/SafE family protein [Sedimentisphaerales bacterium]